MSFGFRGGFIKIGSFTTVTGSPVVATVLGSGNFTFNGSSVGTTASVSPNADEVIYLFVAGHAPSGPVPDDSFSVSGNGLTWVRVEEHPDAGRRSIICFRAMGSSPSAGAITVTEIGASDFSFRDAAYTVVQCSNCDQTGTNGSGATGTPATNTGSGTSLGLTITGTPGANDITLAAMCVEDGTTGLAGDALWANLDSETLADLDYMCDWDSGADLSPTWTWTTTKNATAIGFIVKAA